MSTVLKSLRREALPLAVLAILALVLQGVAGPVLAAAGAQDAPGLQIICLNDAVTSGDTQSAPSGHEAGFCTCGPACPHGAACQALRGLGPASWSSQPPEAMSVAEWQYPARALHSERFGALSAIRGPPMHEIVAG
ncbi:hypothetical protein [Stappia sp. ES.058]|uniref:hypothetical protein n=1 Tax=Stappia sp. ES.058 TaxID=1881061 RepID=UPI001560D102|nr:hypothetical protein [Stappia sp. ES.058]